MSTAATRRFASQKRKKHDAKKDKGLFAETLTVAPAPSRDYYALHLYQKKFLWTRWKISHGPCANPIQKTISIDQFVRDLTLQNELTYIFGEDTTNLMKDLAHEKWSLVSMPSNVLQKIFSYISVSDILRMSQVCKRFSKECSKDELWKTICKKQWKILIHSDIEKANLIGWKNVYLDKMRPKRYRSGGAKSNVIPRSRITLGSTLNTPDSRARSNYSIHKRVQELKVENLRSSSEIFGKEFKTISASTGKSTERILKSRCTSRNSEFRPFSSGKLNITPRSNFDGKYYHKTTRSAMSLVPVMENPRESDEGSKNRSSTNVKVKCRVVNVRANTARSSQPPPFQSDNLSTSRPRPSTGKTVKSKQ